MKKLLFISTLIFLASCTSPSNQLEDNKEAEEITIQKDTFSIQGLWVMTDYVDSILTHKTISNYRMQRPNWFSILIDIDEDSLRSYGSIFDLEVDYRKNSDTLHTFDKTISGQWILTLNQDSEKLELRNVDSPNEETDTNVYVFEKRPELKFLLDTLDAVHKTRTSFRNFFSDELFKGEYEVIGTGEKVDFGSNRQINGLEGFSRFELDVYFGTSHPFDNLDNIRFYRELPKDSEEFQWELYNWGFSGDTLILRQFIWELYDHKGRNVRDEIWELSDEEVKMKKL